MRNNARLAQGATVMLCVQTLEIVVLMLRKDALKVTNSMRENVGPLPSLN